MVKDFNPPRLPKNFRINLDNVNEQLQDISVRMGNIIDMGSMFHINTRSVDDLTQKLDRIARISKKLAKTMHERISSEISYKKIINDLANKMQHDASNQQKAIAKINRLRQLGHNIQLINGKKVSELIRAQQALSARYGNMLKKHTQEYEQQKKLLEQLDGKWTMIGKLIGNSVLGAIDNLGKSILSLSLDSVFFSFSLIKKGVESIYDLMSRTVGVVGEFNMGLGGTSRALATLQKEGWELEGILRPLSDAQLGIGLKELREVTNTFGFTNKALSTFRKTAALAGGALGLGSSAAGELARMMKLMGFQGKEVASQLIAISDVANMAEVPVANLAREINSARGFMITFGRAGQATIRTAISFSKAIGISVKTLENFTNLTDTFENTATMTAKLNTVFGTTINSLSMMLEQDPSKRMEMIRRQFKEQGRTWESMNRQERKFFSQTMNLSEEEAAAILENGMTLDEFDKRRKIQQKTENQAQKELRAGLLKTVSTLNNWSLTMDRITKAFSPLLRSFTDFIGLTKTLETDEGWKPFSKRVDQVVKRVEKFFGMLGKNKHVKELIRMLSNDFKNILNTFTSDGPKANDMMSNMVKAIGSAAIAVKDLYTFGRKVFVKVFTQKNVTTTLNFFGFIARNASKILAVWAGMKALSIAGGVFTGMKAFLDVSSMLGGGKAFVGVITGFRTALMKIVNLTLILGSGLQGVISRTLPMFSAGLSKMLGYTGSGISNFVGFLKTDVTKAFQGVTGKLGAAGLVAAVGLAGWELGRFVSSLEVGGKKIDDWVVLGYEKIDEFGSNLWKAFKNSKIGKLLGIEQTPLELLRSANLTEKVAWDMLKVLKAIANDTATEKQKKTLLEVSKVSGKDFVKAMDVYAGNMMSKERIETLMLKAKRTLPVRVTPELVPPKPEIEQTPLELLRSANLTEKVAWDMLKVLKAIANDTATEKQKKTLLEVSKVSGKDFVKAMDVYAGNMMSKERIETLMLKAKRTLPVRVTPELVPPKPEKVKSADIEHKDTDKSEKVRSERKDTDKLARRNINASNSEVMIVAGDIYLDSNIIGKHMARLAGSAM